VQFSELVLEVGVSPLHTFLFDLNFTNIFITRILKIKEQGHFFTFSER